MGPWTWMTCNGSMRRDGGWRRSNGSGNRRQVKMHRWGGGLKNPPFGLRVASDCAHLEEDPEEMRALNTMMELIVQDISLPRMAEELNRRGCATRDGKPWSAVTIFNVFPRLIDVTPRIFSGDAWPARRREIARVTWNS
ncbi:MAG TPA: recombinase family protein [Candidatus Dormibacteraeota bacterium]|nr:recombinase family protein [Candidatus Dormibacteraeota bacterium]